MGDHKVLVEGTASRSVTPDKATLSVRVKETDQDQKAAFARCVPRMNELVRRLTDVLGPDGRVTSEQVRVHRDWDEYDERRQNLQRAAWASVVVECAPAAAAHVVTEAMQLGADEIAALRYSLRDPTPLLEDLLEDAVTAARRKAKRLAEASGRTLGEVVSLEERSRHDWDEDGIVEVASGGDEGLMLQPGQLTLAVAVRVTFAMT